MATTGASVGDRKRPGPYDVFICYDRDDAKMVERLVEALEDRGINTWLDRDDIRYGKPWEEEVHRGIQNSHSFVYVVTPNSLKSAECIKERETADELEKRVIAALCAAVDERQLGSSLTRRQWVEFTDRKDFDDSVSDLVEAVKHDAWMERHTEFLGRAQAWKDAGEDTDHLLTGKRLAAAELWLEEAEAREGRRVTELQHDYLDAGRRRARRQRWAKRLAIATPVIAAVAVLASLLVDARNDERIAQARELASEAMVKTPTDPELGMLLALESLELGETADADHALRTAVGQSRIRRTLGEARKGLDHAVQDVAFSRDGKHIVTGSRDGQVRVWPLDGRGEPVTFEGGHGKGAAVAAVKFSRDGELVASVGDDQTVRLWNARTGSPIARLRHPRGTNDVSFLPKARGILTVGLDRDDRPEWRLWDLEGNPKGTPRSFGPRLSIDPPVATLDKRGRSFVVASEDTAWVWRLDEPGAAPVRLHHGVQGSTVAFSSDGRRVAMADRGTGGLGQDASATIWDARSGELEHTLESAAGEIVYMAFSPDGRLLVTGNQQGSATVWDARRGERLRELRGHNDVVQDIDFSDRLPAGSRFLLTGSDDRNARIWDLADVGEPDDQRALEVGDRTVAILHGRRAPEMRVRLDEDGERVAMAHGDGTVSVFDSIPGEIDRHRAGNFDFDLSPDGTNMAIMEWDRSRLDFRVAVWNPRSWERDGRWIDRDGSLYSAFISADGTRLFRSDEEGDELVITLADRTNPDTDVQLKEAPKVASAAAFSTDSRRLATGHENGSLRVWNASSGELADGGKLVPKSDREGDAPAVRKAWSVAFNPDGDLLAAARADGSIKLWRAARGDWTELELPAGHSDQAFAVTFSHDGELLATTGNDGRVLVWNTSERQLVSELLGHDAGPITSASFSKDDRFLATSGWDGTVRIWDPATDRQLAEYVPEGGRVGRVAFMEDGVSFVAQAGDGRLVRMRCEVCAPLDEVAALARRRLEATGRKLTPEERLRYLHDD